MPDFAPNYTPRYKIRYTVQGKTHSMQFRTLRTAAPGWEVDIRTKIANVLTALSPNRFTDWLVLSASSAQVDSDVFLPTPAPLPAPGTASASGRLQAQAAMATSFVGRSATGGRAALFVYGTNQNVISITGEQDWRLVAGEDVDYDSAIAALNAAAGPLHANDNGLVIWYPYANLKYNDYWVRKIRQG